MRRESTAQSDRSSRQAEPRFVCAGNDDASAMTCSKCSRSLQNSDSIPNPGELITIVLCRERRCKRVYFIGNAEGAHNAVSQDMLKASNGGWQFYDAQITAKGITECILLSESVKTRKPPVNFQLVVVSPLTRALQVQ